LFNRKINFEFNVSAKEVALQSPRYAEVLNQTTPLTAAAPAPQTAPVQKEELISKDEPFSMQDFSAKETVAAGAVTQNILNLFDGQIINTKDENA